MKEEYFIMDGRARFDVDRAIIVECCNSLKEAERTMKRDYKGYDYVIVRRSDMTVVEGLKWKN